MMKALNYTIHFLSEWHCGSGLSRGAEADADLIKDEHGLPFVPGKTIKGLLRFAINEIKQVQPELVNEKIINSIFGVEGKEIGNAFFSNATLVDYKDIIDNQLSDYLFKNVASTQIDENGVAKDKSLRVMEVCIPVVLSGSIQIPQKDKDQIKDLLEMAMKWTRAIGVNRNRGLGRCIIQIEKYN